MDVNKEQDVEDDRPPSPYVVLQQVSEGVVRVASEAIHGVNNGSSSSGTGGSELPVVARLEERTETETLSSGTAVGAETPNSSAGAGTATEAAERTETETPSSSAASGAPSSGTGVGAGISSSSTGDATPSSGTRVEAETPSSAGTATPSSSMGTGARTGTGHRRVQSEVGTNETKPRHARNTSFQKLKIHVQRAFQMGGSKEEPKKRINFNPEVLVNQKRQWYQIRNKKADVSVVYKGPTSLFENFVIVGLPSDANLRSAEEVFAKKKKWELQMAKTDVFDIRTLKYRGACYAELEPQILFKYPPGKKLAVHSKELPAFCFPQDVKARLMERTPSMSDLNAIVHGQEHLGRDDLSFIFSLKGADNTTLFGVCLHVQEIVQRSPGIIGVGSPFSQLSGGLSRFLVSAPRCYCLLTRVPFFELHYEMLNSIVTQERLNRITQFISEMNITDYGPSSVGEQDGINDISDTRNKKDSTDWTAFAIPVDCAGALTAAAIGIITDDEVQSFSSRLREPGTPESVSTASEVSDISQTKEIDKESGKGVHQFDGYSSETLESPCSDFERMYGNYVNGHASPVVDISFCERRESSESLFSSVRSMGSEDEVSSIFDKNAGDDTIIKWAKDHKNELLQIVCSYHALPLPRYGDEIVFQPLEHLQAIKYSRPAISSFGLHGIPSDIDLQSTLLSAAVNVRLAAAEEAFSLSIWTTATICRALSLDSILAIVAGVLLEKQVVVVCPNLGVLSAVVLSLIPMIRPFEWQSLLLPVLPRKLLEFLEAPVPFIVGIQHKPADVKLKTANLIYVDVNKDKVTICYMPPLPRHKELISELMPIHATLSSEKYVAKRHPVYKCSEVQAEAAGQFSNIMMRYLESLCSDLRSHSITNVQSNNDKVSLLFKDSFIDSFPNKDRPFVKLLLDTQLFSVLSDTRLSSFEVD